MAAGGAAASAGAVLPLLFASLCYVGCSTGLIAFNKFLVHEDRFPFAITLVLLHMSCSFFICLGLFFVKPDWFPSLQAVLYSGEGQEDEGHEGRDDGAGDVEKEAAGKQAAAADSDVSKRKHLRGREVRAPLWERMLPVFATVLPISLFFAGTLVLSNMAYLYCSLAFLQMMKEGNLALVYLGSLLLGLEKGVETRVAGILLFIMGATSMTIYGELHFVWLGFVIQLGSQCCEVGKILLQNRCLAAENPSAEKTSKAKAAAKMDPLSFVLTCSPCSIPVLLVPFFLLEYEKSVLFEHLYTWRLHLLANAVVAFFLNVSIAFFMKHASAVSFLVCGVAKDVFIVLCSVLLFGETVGALQGSFFGFQIYGIVLYTLVRGFPHLFRDDEWAAWTLAKLLVGFVCPVWRSEDAGNKDGSRDDGGSDDCRPSCGSEEAEAGEKQALVNGSVSGGSTYSGSSEDPEDPPR